MNLINVSIIYSLKLVLFSFLLKLLTVLIRSLFIKILLILLSFFTFISSFKINKEKRRDYL